MATQIKAITLDFFQTLVHHRLGDGGRGRALMAYFASQNMESKEWEHQVLYDVLEPHKREYSPNLARTSKERYLIQLCGRLFERMGIAVEAHDPAQHGARIWELIGPSSLELYPEVVGSLRALREAGYPLAIISNWQCGLGHYCEELGIGRYFDCVVASAEVGYAKPHGAIFAEAMKCLGTPAHQMLHIGDSAEDDLSRARAAGMHALQIDRGGDGRPAVADAISSLADILSLLEQRRGDPPS